jgi:tyrosine-protein phosphatase SIW14
LGQELLAEVATIVPLTEGMVCKHRNPGIPPRVFRNVSFSSSRLIGLLIVGLPAFAGSAPGIKNFDKVDAHVYRGGQPTSEGFRYLAGLGIGTVVDLREPGDRSKQEESIVTGAGMKYVNVPMSGLVPPSEAQIAAILALLENSSAAPVFVHCMRGADRTGAVIAAYHIDHDKWDNARALRDAREHRMSFFQLPRQSYIRNFRPRGMDAHPATVADATTALSVAAAIPAARN